MPVEVIQRGAQQAVSCAVCRVEGCECALYHGAGDLFDRRRVETAFAFEVVVEEGLIDFG